MTKSQIDLVLRHFCTLIASPAAADSTDHQLLKRFAAWHHEPAFESLLQRHGPMVWNVCRRVLRYSHDAEDAFQATFLVLIRKAGSLDRRGSLGNWLYTVAYRIALRARADAARRQQHESQAPALTVAEPETNLIWRDLRCVLDAELSHLPEKYRAPLVLCYLQGKTNDEAAQQ